MTRRFTSSRRDVIKQGTVLGGMAVGAASFARYTPGASAAQLDRSETLFVGGMQWGPPTTFNPLSPNAPWPTDTYFTHIYETLYTFNMLSGEIEPLLAADLPVEDEASLTITLKEGTMFQDGEALTAEDVVYSMTIPQRQGGHPVQFDRRLRL